MKPAIAMYRRANPIGRIGPAVLTAAAIALSGCASTRMEIAETFGYAKREQLVDKVESARDGQEAAKKQFESALAEFMAVTGAEVGELEERYAALKREYDRSESKADAVRSRIKEVERVAAALFNEWEDELALYSSDELRRASTQQLEETRALYDRLVNVMKTAEATMDPVLAAFKDQVLFLKHNLNARAIASLQGNSAQLKSDIESLVREMEAAIAEADSFIDSMKRDGEE